ncbi:MAG: hypothetical protein ABWU16_03895, partial [Halothiobacillaceae bacterium]
MKHHERRLNGAKALLLALIQLGLMLMAPAAQALTRANFDKVSASFLWESASTPINLRCNDCAQLINIGFDFPFAGERFNRVYVSSNGLISLLSGVTNPSNTDLPTSGMEPTTSALIMPYWDDLNPT